LYHVLTAISQIYVPDSIIANLILFLYFLKAVASTSNITDMAIPVAPYYIFYNKTINLSV